MQTQSELCEIKDFTGSGYRPVIDYETWRIAILNFSEDLKPENLKAMQRHNETDEVFVLLRGRCMLFFGSGADSVESIFAADMQPQKIYNIKKGVWHTHTLSRDAMVLIVENKDTTYANSPFCPLTFEQQQYIIDLAASFA